MKRRIGLIVSTITFGLLSNQCSSDPEPGDGAAGSPPVAGAPAAGSPPVSGSGPGGTGTAGSPAGAPGMAGGGMGGVAGSSPGGTAGTAPGGSGGSAAGSAGAASGAGGSAAGAAGASGSGGRGGGGGSGGGSAGSAGSAGSGKGGSGGGNAGSGGGGAGGPAATFAQVQTILTTNCALSGCHNGSTPHVDLRSGGMLYSRLTSPLTVQDCNGRTMVVPNMPSMSLLVQIVQPNPPCARQMPNMCGMGGRQCLSQADITTITNWVNAGAPM